MFQRVWRIEVGQRPLGKIQVRQITVIRVKAEYPCAKFFCEVGCQIGLAGTRGSGDSDKISFRGHPHFSVAQQIAANEFQEEQAMSSNATILFQAFPISPFFSRTTIELSVVLALIAIVGVWKMFQKAGRPGWAVLIPIYNAYVLLKVAGRPGWWLLLAFIPLVNLVIFIIVSIDLAKAFGQSAAFGIILIFVLGGIGYLILGMGNYRYLGPQHR